MIWYWIVLIIVGGVLGWLASKIMRTDPQQGIFLNIVVGIVGALLGTWIWSLLGGEQSGVTGGEIFDIGALLVSLLGAIILLAIVNLITRGRAR